MANLIKIKRGLKEDLPTLEIGELGFCTDTNELFIGKENENILISATDILTIDTKSENYTLVLSDSGKVIIFNSPDDLTLTVPLNSSVEFEIGTQIAIIRNGAGDVTFVAGAGVTILSIDEKVKISDQHGSAALLKIGTDIWQLIGSLG
jgi:hypothetical protein